MAEGISENPPPKKHGAFQILEDFIRGLDPKERIKRKIRKHIKVLPDEKEDEPSTLPTLEQNIKASEKFIRALRNPRLYSQSRYDARFLKSNLGYSVEGQSVEKGWFEVNSVVKTAEDRYRLPLAIYIDNDHAKLLVKGPYWTTEGRKIKVYNPMLSNFQERRVGVDVYGIPVGAYTNVLAGRRISKGDYDVTKFLEAPDIAKYADLLTNIKAFNFQREYYNCIPYCLFVGAMLYGLESGDTEFKTRGIKQFEQDFGVRIITREEILPKNPRIRIIE